ncbi:hypothetical protein AB0A95_18600 [Micromonospora sp. NPDC049230]|uniref:hypothetical protein n=1 Tax=Micromonospora sp. NPDC049230 TaxID=3155502 RepID=UPI0033E43AE9
MRFHLAHAGVALSAAVASVALFGAPASAAPTGLSFYSDQFTTQVANFAHPDGSCTAFPSTAVSLVAWSDTERVTAYRGVACTGGPIELGGLATFAAGDYVSFRAS